eukprot:CAMPEP_0175792870 /NCGR_PEP_ID=MMETSP0097-20121207/83182_1 /TAXON_ID=311494 /ORGANISM="Alexandrium monilatum, Strain CCMP3105" /LENGTH=238 /DNA_ID=CAMNT_0017104057 /DNA_START=133 /DNA_END=847 /DNA_ORIENTATION=+
MLRVHADQHLDKAGVPAQERAAQEQRVPSHTCLHLASLVAGLHVQGLDDSIDGGLQRLEVQAELLHRLHALRRQLLEDRLELPLRHRPGEHVVSRGDLDVLHGVVVLVTQVVDEGAGHRARGVLTRKLPQDDVGRGVLAVLQLRDGRGPDLLELGLQPGEPHLDGLECNALDGVRDVHLQDKVLLEHVLDDLDGVLRLALREGLRLATVLQRPQLPLAGNLAEHAHELRIGGGLLRRL